jgi:hypothetical protein
MDILAKRMSILDLDRGVRSWTESAQEDKTQNLDLRHGGHGGDTEVTETNPSNSDML